MHRALITAGILAFVLALGMPLAATEGSASATFTVSVEVVRSCTVQTAGSGSVDCHGQTPSTMRVTTETVPAPEASTSSQSQVLTILF